MLVSVDGRPSIVFTRRSETLTLHALEISFLGGHHDAHQDASLLQTALRETREELLGLPVDTPPPLPTSNTFASDLLDKIQIWGQATSIPSTKGTPVTPFFGILLSSEKPEEDETIIVDLQDPISNMFPGNPSEVDLVFSIPLQELIKCETFHQLPQNRFGIVRAPLYPTVYGKIWGLTAFILQPLLRQILKPVFVISTIHEEKDANHNHNNNNKN